MPTKQRKSDQLLADFDDVTIATEDDEAEHPAAPILRAAIDLQEELKRTGVTPKQLYIIRQQREVFTQVFALLRKLANPTNNDHPAAPILRQMAELEQQQKDLRLKVWAILQSEGR